MRQVTVNNQVYFVDGYPKELKEKLGCFYKSDFQLAKLKVKFYNHKYTQGDSSVVAQVRSFFDGIKQPTEALVRRAMVLVIDEDYALKSGGESASDRIYSSSLKIMIADPQTGFDKDVVLLKKYSTVFEEVLITPEEISDLFEACLTSTEKVGVLKDESFSILNELTRWKRGVKSTFTDGDRVMPLEFAIKMVNKYKGRGITLEMYQNALKHRVEWVERDFETTIIEDDPNRNKTKEFHNNARATIKALNEAYEFIQEQYQRVAA